MRTINREYREIAVGLLHPHPKNYNRGDLEVIGESVQENGFYGAVTVHDHPELPGEFQILAGEHRWRTAIEEHADTVPCIIVDTDDPVHAARILLVDNESAKRSTYDADKLTDLLRDIGTLQGTGFDLAGLSDFEDERAAQDPGPSDGDDAEDEEEFVREYGVVVYADDEAHQEGIYNKCREMGWKVRVASI